MLSWAWAFPLSIETVLLVFYGSNILQIDNKVRLDKITFQHFPNKELREYLKGFYHVHCTFVQNNI